MTGGYTMKEKNIRELAKRMGLVTVEDMCQYTIAQLVVKIANKVNELVDEVWRFETDVQEMLKTQNENIQYLLGEGLHLEVENIFDGWVQDGTFDTLINQTALKKVNDRIDDTNAQLSDEKKKTTYFVTPEMFAGTDTEKIQRAIDYLVDNRIQGTVILSGDYVIDSTITVDASYVSLEGFSCRIDCKNVVGDAFVITGGAIKFNDLVYQGNKKISGILLRGNRVAGNSGFKFAGNTVCSINFYNCEIEEFGEGMVFESNSYILNFFGCSVGRCDIGLHMPAGFDNYGENINFHGGAIANNAKCVVIKNPNGTFRFNSTSFDYSAELLIAHGGSIICSNCHFEFRLGSGNETSAFQCSTSSNITLEKSVLIGSGSEYTRPHIFEFTKDFDYNEPSVITIKDCQVFNLKTTTDYLCGGNGGILNIDNISSTTKYWAMPPKIREVDNVKSLISMRTSNGTDIASQSLTIGDEVVQGYRVNPIDQNTHIIFEIDTAKTVLLKIWTKHSLEKNYFMNWGYVVGDLYGGATTYNSTEWQSKTLQYYDAPACKSMNKFRMDINLGTAFTGQYFDFYIEYLYLV